MFFKKLKLLLFSIAQPRFFSFLNVDYFGASKILSWGHHFDYLFIAHSEWRTWEERMEVFGLSFQDLVPDVLKYMALGIFQRKHALK